MRYVFPILLSVLFVLSACKATKKAYERGDYETAIFNSIDRLQKSPNNKKARTTLAQAYPSMVDYYKDRIEDLKLSGDTYKWEKINDYYTTLNRAYAEISRVPAATRVVPNPQNFRTEQSDAEYKAAEVRYALGMKDLEKGRDGYREAAKSAYLHFKKADDYRRNFKDVRNLMEESMELAILVVVIEPIPMHSRTLALSNEFFENQMVEFIKNTQLSPFVRFVSPKDTRMMDREPDHVIQMVFDDFVVGQAYVKETVYNREKDSVIVGEVKVGEDSTANVYGTVKAEVHQFKKEITSSGLLDFRILNARSGSVVTQQKFPGTFIWLDKWGFYNGDDRALESEDKEFMRRKRESPNPPPQDLFIEFTKPIFDQVTSFVRNHYKDY
ncbi:MAG: hypothetical protein R3B93_25825 [Bacteroidia bacterium]